MTDACVTDGVVPATGELHTSPATSASVSGPTCINIFYFLVFLLFAVRELTKNMSCEGVKIEILMKFFSSRLVSGERGGSDQVTLCL